MRIEQLEQALIIYEENSISGAADRLFISQPNLSLSLKNLEDELGFQIFVRSKKGVTITEPGKEFLEMARRTVDSFHAIKNFSGLVSDNCLKPKLTLSVACQYLHFPETEFVAIMQENEDNLLKFSYIDAPFEDILNLVSKKEADVGFVAMTKGEKKILLRIIEGYGLTYTPLCTASGIVIAGPKNPLFNSKKDTVSRDDLTSCSIISYPNAYYSFGSGSELRRLLESKNTITVSDWSMIYDVVYKTSAISISMQMSGSEQTSDTFRLLPIEGADDFLEIGWVHSNGSALSGTCLDLIERIIKKLK